MENKIIFNYFKEKGIAVSDKEIQTFVSGVYDVSDIMMNEILEVFISQNLNKGKDFYKIVNTDQNIINFNFTK